MAITVPDGLTDADVAMRHTFFNITLVPATMDAAPPSPFLYHWRFPALGNNNTASAAATAYPIHVPHPYIRLSDEAIGTREPNGFIETYGAYGQSPTIDARALHSNGNSDGLTGDPSLDPLVGAKHGGRVYCEAVSPLTIRCVLPRHGGYALYEGDRLALSVRCP